jgi:hypothetical protein
MEIVVTRYKEQLQWLNNNPFNKYPVTIYNKGNDTNIYFSPNIKKIINLPNKGLDVHSFIYHIVNNYDNLSNITAFFQGSIDKREYKYDRCVKVINESEKKNTTIISCTKENNFIFSNKNFILDNYFFSTKDNISENSNLTYPCKIRPFGEWFHEIFNKWHKPYDEHIDTYTTNSFNYISYCHIFSIKKEHILRKPKEYYIYLLSFLNEGLHPEAVHYFERAWSLIFYPLDEENFIF